MNACFFVPFSAKLRQSETCYVLLMSDVSSKMIPYHPLARISFVILSRMRLAIICSSSFCITAIEFIIQPSYVLAPQVN